ncbi:MAG: RNA polymerase sigma factor [Planctomycetota bacterium]
MALSNLDRELLNDCLAGSDEAWRGFCERYVGLILHVVKQLSSSYRIPLDDATTEDLVADVFLAFLDRDCAVLRQFRGESSLATYLVVIARRTVMKQLVRRRAVLTRSSIELDALQDPATGTPGTINALDWSSPEAIQGLSNAEASAIRMFHLEGKSYREIGNHLGMAENSIGPFLSRAREKLRRRA